MASVLLTCYQNIPGVDRPGTPALVHFDNGDWEIAFNGDVDYISESPAYVGSNLIAELLSEISLELDGDEMDSVDGEVILFVEATIETGVPDELVLGLWRDGEASVMSRADAAFMIEADQDEEQGVYNFVPLPDLFDDLRKFLSRNRTKMFGHDEDDERPSLDFDEERD